MPLRSRLARRAYRFRVAHALLIITGGGGLLGLALAKLVYPALGLLP